MVEPVAWSTSAWAWGRTKAFDDRPICPVGVSQSRTKLRFDLVACLGSGDGSPEDGLDVLQRAGAEGCGRGGEPAVDIFGGQISELACSQCWDDVLVGQDAPGRHGVVFSG